MDAVFLSQNIYERDEIFRQEGWSYKLDEKESDLEYNGVVYNEMKGAFSSPEGVLDRVILNTLFPDTSYRNESGGDPDVIPELTYEQIFKLPQEVLSSVQQLYLSVLGIWTWRKIKLAGSGILK